MGFIKARGSNFYYEEQGEGPPILLIPPAGDDHRTGRVHLWVAQPRLYALHHALTGPGHPDGKGA